MDKIWVKTLARLDAIEERCKNIEFCLQHPDLPAPGEPQPKPESEKDTVDLPKIV